MWELIITHQNSAARFITLPRIFHYYVYIKSLSLNCSEYSFLYVPSSAISSS